MGKYISIELINDTNHLNVDLDAFDRLLSYFTGSEHEGEDYISLTLSKGKCCHINPGIYFEITSYDYTHADPGYIIPRGNGCCDIYSENGETTILLKRYKDRENAYGICRNQHNNIMTFGPFNKNNKKYPKQTTICYFNSTNGNFEDVSGTPTSNDYQQPSSHCLMIIKDFTLFILDHQPDAYKRFSTQNHWKDHYANHFTLSGSNMEYHPDFVKQKQELDLSPFIPEGHKINIFICRTRLNEKLIGIKLILSDRIITLPYSTPDKTICFFPILQNAFLIIPEEPDGQLLYCKRPDHMLAQSASIIGEHVGTTHIVNHSISFFPQTNTLTQNQNESIASIKKNVM